MSATTSSRRRVLIVEDDAMVGIYLEDLLLDLGCEVLGPIATAQEAQSFAEFGEFEFALLDVNLDEGTSFAAAEILNRRGMPFAFLTAYGPAGVREDLRMAPTLSKPVIVRMLKQVLGAAGLI